MNLRDAITQDMKASMKAGEKLRLSTLRLLLSSIKYKEVDLKRELNDEEVLLVISTLVRQRQDSIEQFRKGSRADLAEKEEKELEILKAYMPAQLSAEEVRSEVKRIAAEAGISGMKDMGRLMKAVMASLKGKADGKTINEAVKEVLGN